MLEKSTVYQFEGQETEAIMVKLKLDIFGKIMMKRTVSDYTRPLSSLSKTLSLDLNNLNESAKNVQQIFPSIYCGKTLTLYYASHLLWNIVNIFNILTFSNV